MTDVTEPDGQAREFIERVERELGYEVDFDPRLGSGLGWFCLELVLVAEGEEFEGDVDFELTEESVEPLYAEITVDIEQTERRQILTRIGERIITTETTETFNYDPDPEELQPLVGDLRELHATVFE
jgi:hypothetical protein